MDIVERLRRVDTYESGTLAFAAADAIEKLRADVDRMASLAIDNARDMLRLQEALRSIASNTCCDRCQEAALVARAALKEGE
jgi:hypothetical protein